MSKGAPKVKSKKERKEKAIKKARKKNIIMISILILIIAVAVFLGIFASNRQNAKQVGAEIYSDGSQTVQLLADGTFNAELAHNKRISGTYTRTPENNRTIVSFNVNGSIEIGSIINNALHFPEEWEDGHHHGNVLPKR
ncbi:MAG: hypothetical protein FWB86_08355 [Treponema sp.]|nr:hypothetical protein [Treponema sp.]MCL2251810.1 hypothetical protein [Treponema sp.]